MHYSHRNRIIKHWVLWIFALILLTAITTHAQGQASTSNPKHKVILIFGDSLSAAYGINPLKSWANLLQQRLTHQALAYTVINASVSGETTQGGLVRFSDTLAEYKPDIVLLALGANDVLRNQSMVAMKSNLQQMISLSKNTHASVLLIGLRMPPTFGKPFVSTFGQSFAALADENHIPLVPLMMQHVSDNAALMQADWLHPNALGQPAILDNIWPSLKPLLD